MLSVSGQIRVGKSPFCIAGNHSREMVKLLARRNSWLFACCWVHTLRKCKYIFQSLEGKEKGMWRLSWLQGEVLWLLGVSLT